MTNIRPMQKHEAKQVVDLWQEACIEAVGHPLSENNAKQVLKNLIEYTTHDLCHCYVALEGTQIVGFITCSITSHPIEPGFGGEIEELYVQPSANRNGIQKQLIHHATVQLKKQGVGVINVRVDLEEAEQLSFWESLGWSNDMTVYAIYSNVPTEPKLQAVWDNYTD